MAWGQLECHGLKVWDLPLTGSTPLELPNFLQEFGGQEVTKEALDFAVHWDLGEVGLLVNCHLDCIVPAPPGVAGYFMAAKDLVTKGVNHFPLAADRFADPSTLPESRRGQAKVS